MVIYWIWSQKVHVVAADNGNFHPLCNSNIEIRSDLLLRDDGEVFIPGPMCKRCERIMGT